MSSGPSHASPTANPGDDTPQLKSSARPAVKVATTSSDLAAAAETTTNASGTFSLRQRSPRMEASGAVAAAAASMPLAHENISVLVRLKAGPHNGSVSSPFSGSSTDVPPPTGRVASSPQLYPPTVAPSLPSSPLRITYSVEDGTLLRTPRTGRRTTAPSFQRLDAAAAATSSPQTSCVARPTSDVHQPQLRQPQPQPQPQQAVASPLMMMAMDTSASSPLSQTASVALTKASPGPQASVEVSSSSSSPLLLYASPDAGGAAGAALDGLAASCATPGAGSQLSASLHSCATGFSAAHGGCIGTRGRLLTIASPNGEERRQYEFGDVLEPDVSNAALCERLLPSVMEQFNAGFSVCVLCYGQTGSGKTYTMHALTPAVAEEVFRTVDGNNDVVELSCIQIYNNRAYNLLDTSRGGKYGAELSRPPTPRTAFKLSGESYGGPGSASEPKYLVRSPAELLSRWRAAARLRVMSAHAMNPASSRSFTLLTVHVTRCVEGVPLTTTRVTLADLAGTERLKKSGATGVCQDQAIFINKSLMALRELIESSSSGGGNNSNNSNNTVEMREVLHFQDSLLTTYLAPRLCSWHLFLLVTVSLDGANYEETKSSLGFATNARRRRVKKVRNGIADWIAARPSAAPQLYSGSNASLPGDARETATLQEGPRLHSVAAAARHAAEATEMQSVVDALQFRVDMLEESLRIAQGQRQQPQQMTETTQRPAPSLRSTLSCSAESADTNAAPALNTATAVRLQRECATYRQLLREREEDLRLLRAHLLTHRHMDSAIFLGSPLEVAQEAYPLSGSLEGPSPTSAGGMSEFGREHSALLEREGGSLAGVSSASAGRYASAAPSPPVQALRQRDPVPDLAAAVTLSTSVGEASTPVVNAVAATAAVMDTDADAHAQLGDILQALCTQLAQHGEAEAEGHDSAESPVPVDQLHDALLRACEEHDGVRERLLVVSASLSGMRAQSRQLYKELRCTHHTLARREEDSARREERLQKEEVRARQAEAAVELLRLQLFQSYAEQPIGEELTRLYLDERPAVDTTETLSGLQLAEHREEMEKIKTHQHALQDKITELVNTVEQLTRAGTQKDVSLASLQSIITPAQRALFQAMSDPRHNTREINTATAPAVGVAASDCIMDGETSADCFSLLQSRVAELRSLLTKEEQQHQLTQCEVVEAREDARRSRQEQRRSFFQQQEEERRVAQLTSENFELRQQNERHQLYLDQIHVHFQEQRVELERYYAAELAEQRHALETANASARVLFAPPPPSGYGGLSPDAGDNKEPEEGPHEDAEDTMNVAFAQTSTRQATSPTPALPTEAAAPEESTARGSTQRLSWSTTLELPPSAVALKPDTATRRSSLVRPVAPPGSKTGAVDAVHPPVAPTVPEEGALSVRKSSAEKATAKSAKAKKKGRRLHRRAATSTHERAATPAAITPAPLTYRSNAAAHAPPNMSFSAAYVAGRSGRRTSAMLQSLQSQLHLRSRLAKAHK